jgi:hypothetical protein
MKNKIKILKLTAILLLAGMVSCGKDDEVKMREIPLDSVNCPCENGIVSNTDIAENGILMFDVSKTSLGEMANIANNGKDEITSWVSIDFESNASLLYHGYFSVGYICNFPNNIINPNNIPYNGILISLKGNVTCNPVGWFDIKHYQLVLTSLKIQYK